MARTRRPNKSGSLYKKLDGKRPWVVQTSDHGSRSSQSFKTEAEARAWLNDAIDSGTKKPVSIPFAKYLQDWLELKAKNSSTLPWKILKKSTAQLRGIEFINYTTYRTYRSVIEKHILPELDHRKRLRLDEVKPADIEAILAEIIDKGATKRIVQMARRILSIALHDAVKLGFAADKNAAADFSTPYKAQERRPLSEQEFAKLLKAAERTRYVHAFAFSGATGLRLGELRGLKWPDVDYSRSVIWVERQAQREAVEGKKVTQKSNQLGRGTATILREPKTESSKRPVPLGHLAFEVLARQKELQEQERQVAWKRKRGWQEMDLIFPSTVGTVMEPTTLRKAYKKSLKDAGLPEDTTIHDLRHLSVTTLASSKVQANFKSIGKRTGQSPDVILLYTHAIDAEDQEIARKQEDVLLSSIYGPQKQTDSPEDDSQDAADTDQMQQNCKQTGESA